MTAAGGDERRKPGPKIGAAARALRDSAIIAQLHAGEDAKAIAREHGLNARQVRNIYAGWRKRDTARVQPPLEIVDRVLCDYEDQLRNLALVAAHSIESLPAVALGALKARADVLERFTELLGDVGKLPENLELFRQEADIVRAGNRLFVLLAEVKAGRLSLDEAEEELDRMFGISERRVVPAEDVIEGFAREQLERGDGDE